MLLSKSILEKGVVETEVTPTVRMENMDTARSKEKASSKDAASEDST